MEKRTIDLLAIVKQTLTPKNADLIFLFEYLNGLDENSMKIVSKKELITYFCICVVCHKNRDQIEGMPNSNYFII